MEQNYRLTYFINVPAGELKPGAIEFQGEPIEHRKHVIELYDKGVKLLEDKLKDMQKNGEIGHIASANDATLWGTDNMGIYNVIYPDRKHD